MLRSAAFIGAFTCQLIVVPLLAVGVAAEAVAAPRVESYSVVSNDEVVGSLEASVDADTARIRYHVSDNGRGPAIEESIRFRHGLPVEYSADGTTAFGGLVRERMRFDGHALHWDSAADAGELPATQPTLYAPNDGTPWVLGALARALLAAPEHALPVAPSGRAALEDLGPRKVGGRDLHVYALKGLSLQPPLLYLDGATNLFAVLEELGEVVIRQGHEGAYRDLLASARGLAFEQAARRQSILAHRYDRPIRVRDVLVFDPRSGRTSEPQSVVVFRGRIATVAPESEAPSERSDEVVVDGQGGTLIPGLHDMHAHNSVESGLFYLAAGVTSVRDNGNVNTDLLELQQGIDGGQLPGPRIWRSGLLEGRSPYSARLGRIAASVADAVDGVRWYAAHGYRMIKIYNSLDPDWVRPVAAEAHRLGLRVHGHIPAFMSPDRAIRDGYDEITHLNQLALGWVLKEGEDTRTPLRLTALGERAGQIELGSAPVQTTLTLMAEHGTAIDPTLAILERLLLSRAGTVAPGDTAYLGHMPIGYQRYRKRSFVSFDAPGRDAAYRAAFERLVELTGALYHRGIRILPGTDDTTGVTVHRELELYAQAGIPVPEVLRLATLGCEQYLQRDQDLGTIEPGKRADLVLLGADPLTDISAIRRVRMVIKDDALYFPDEIYPTLGIVPFATHPPVFAPAPAGGSP